MSVKKAAQPKKSEQVKVVVRCRPMNKKEVSAGYKSVINVSVPQSTIQIRETKAGESENKYFTFDAVYDFTSTQEQLYKESVQPIVESVLNGYNATIFAYGQTGTGKTYTMEGDRSNLKERGVIPRSFDHIFEHITEYTDVKHKVTCSYIEIYQDEIKDLLDERGNTSYKLRGNTNNVYIEALKGHVCKSAADMKRAMKTGNSNRKTGATDMNEHSSRSHAIFTITVEMTRTVCDMKHVKIGKLNLVDLAGSERQTKSKSCGVRLKEATKINLSLSALGNVISALSSDKPVHVPYRNSKLTRVLQDSLGGSARTLMIANVGPACYNSVESLNTLKYAHRAKSIKNKPFLNENTSQDEMIAKCQTEVERLRNLVQAKYLEEHPPQPRRGIKRTRGDVVREDIDVLKDAVDDEETRLYETCEKIVHLQEWKENVERHIGTDIKSYTQRQEAELANKTRDLELTELRTQEIKRRIESEREKILEQHSRSDNETYGVVKHIDTFHKIVTALSNIRAENAKINEQFDKERIKLETEQKELLRRHGFNQIVIENFLSEDISKKFMKRINEGTPPPSPNPSSLGLGSPNPSDINVASTSSEEPPCPTCALHPAERNRRMMADPRFFNYTSNNQNPHQSEFEDNVASTSYNQNPRQSEFEDNVASTSYNPNPRRSGFNDNVASTSYNPNPRQSRFKDNVRVRTNEYGQKEYVIVDEMTYERLLAVPKPFPDRTAPKRNVKTLQDSLTMLKTLLK